MQPGCSEHARWQVMDIERFAMDELWADIPRVLRNEQKSIIVHCDRIWCTFNEIANWRK